MRQAGRLSILLMLVAATAAAQDQPDFSGRWILETSAGAGPDVAQSLTVRQPVVRTNAFGAPMPPYFKELSVDREFVSGVRTETFQIGIEGGTIGATTTDVKVSRTVFSVRWEDQRLVIDTGSYSGPTREAGPYTGHTEVAGWMPQAGWSCP